MDLRQIIMIAAMAVAVASSYLGAPEETLFASSPAEAVWKSNKETLNSDVGACKVEDNVENDASADSYELNAGETDNGRIIENGRNAAGKTAEAADSREETEGSRDVLLLADDAAMDTDSSNRAAAANRTGNGGGSTANIGSGTSNAGGSSAPTIAGSADRGNASAGSSGNGKASSAANNSGSATAPTAANNPGSASAPTAGNSQGNEKASAAANPPAASNANPTAGSSESAETTAPSVPKESNATIAADTTGDVGDSSAAADAGSAGTVPQYGHTTSIYTNDESTLLRVEYYDDNNSLFEYSYVTDYDKDTNSYTESIYRYDNENQVEVPVRTDIYVNGELASSEKH